MAATVQRFEEQAGRLTGALESARRARYEAESPDREVAITVDGRPRVAAARISARAIRAHGATGLGPVLTEVLNDALAKAAAGTQALLRSEVGDQVTWPEDGDR